MESQEPARQRDGARLSPRNSLFESRKSFVDDLLPQPNSSGHAAGFQEKLMKACLLLAALFCYSCGGLLVNWSVLVAEPPEARFVKINLPARSAGAFSDTQWLGAELQLSADGIFIEKVYEEPKRAGRALGRLLTGDTVLEGVQEGQRIFGSVSFQGLEGLTLRKKVTTYLSTPVETSLPTHVGLIDPSKPLEVTFRMQGVVMKKGEPYLAIGIVLSKAVLGTALLMIIVKFTTPEHMGTIISLQTLRILALPAFGWTLADLCEILASGKLNAALLSILSQARLIGTALCMYVTLGQKQTLEQVSVLLSLSLLILCYLQIPDKVDAMQSWSGFGKPKNPNMTDKEETDPMGYVYAFAQIFLRIVVGVIGQKAFQNPLLKDFPLVALQAALFLYSLVIMIPATFLFTYATGWTQGFFGGEDVEFRHCNQAWTKWTDEKCQAETPFVVHQGWRFSTVIVMLFYVFKDLALKSVIKVFDALTKDLINAAATVATYFLSLVLPPAKDFNLAKCGLVFVLIFQIQQYSSLPKHSGPPQPSGSNGRSAGLPSVQAAPVAGSSSGNLSNDLPGTSSIQLQAVGTEGSVQGGRRVS